MTEIDIETIQHVVLIAALVAAIYCVCKLFEIIYQELMDKLTDDRHNSEQSTERGEERD